MKRGYQESSSSGSLRPPQSKIRHNPEGDAHFLEDESTKVFARKVADHYSARMNQTLEEQGASPIIHLKKLNNCIESVLIQLYAHRGDAVLDLACGKLSGRYKEEGLVKKLQQMMMEEEKQRIPIAQGLPWTTYKPVAEKMGLIEQYKEERERQQKLAKEEEIRRLRKELIPRAQPMPYFDRPFIPRRSMKHCTIPREPKFHKPPQHKKIKCGMICSHTNSEMQRRKKNQDFS